MTPFYFEKVQLQNTRRKRVMTNREREVSLQGVPSYFRYCVIEAQRGYVPDGLGGRIEVDFFHPGWHLAIHLDEYLSDEALDELGHLGKIEDDDVFERELQSFLERECPRCLRLIPQDKRPEFMEGILRAMEEGRFPIWR